MKSFLLSASLMVFSALSLYAQDKKEPAPMTPEENKAFMEKNKKEPGVVTLPSGLQYKIIKEGEGVKPADTAKVCLHFDLKLLNGKELGNTYASGRTWDHHLDKGFPAWSEVVPMMPAGSKWKLWIPPALGYGEEGDGGSVTPGSVIVCELEYVKLYEFK